MRVRVFTGNLCNKFCVRHCQNTVEQVGAVCICLEKAVVVSKVRAKLFYLFGLTGLVPTEEKLFK